MPTASNLGVVPPLLRGDVYWVKLDPVIGHGKGKTRPAVVIQNNDGNELGALVIVAVITSTNLRKAAYKAFVPKGDGNLQEDSMVDCAQIRTVDKVRLLQKIGCLSEERMAEVDKALRVSLDLN